MADASFINKKLRLIKPIYQQISDCINPGAVKKRGDTYLPRPNPADESDENVARYQSYLTRAVFYGVTNRTLYGLLGQIFMRPAEKELPPKIDELTANIDGSGLTLDQQSRQTCALAIALGRAGLFVDYPDTPSGSSKADLMTGSIRPVISLHKPEHIINWRTKERGALSILALVVIRETYTDTTDDFEQKEEVQYRVLRLGKSTQNTFKAIVDDENIYTVEIWRGESGQVGITESYQPKDAAGKYFDTIPFTFVGSENNDERIDNPPLFDMSELNIGHYRNSADYEESSFIAGQPTPYFAGLTADWVNDVMGGKVLLGARAAIPLPEGGSAGLLQALANTMPFEAMEHKEKQMAALGAKLVENNGTKMTATQAAIEESSENSILSTIASNVSAAYVTALEYCGRFLGETGEIIYELNKDFGFYNMDAQEILAIVESWQRGAISKTEMRTRLRSGGIVTQEDEEAEEELSEETGTLPNLDTE